MMKRVISVLLILVMLTGMLPVFAQAEQTETNVDNGGLTVKGTNSFGNLVSEGISLALEETEEGKSGYAITGLEVNGRTATVTYDTLEEAILVVAIYTEDGSQLLCSGHRAVVSEEHKVMVTLPEISEPFFMAEAFLMDRFDYSPLCQSFDTPMYTSDMQKLLVSTVEDYEPDRVLNLDEDPTTNFAVFTDGAVIIEATEESNILISADDERCVYIFEKADAQLTGLETGTTVAYLHGNGEMLLFKVANMTIEGTTVTVNGGQMELQDVFAYMKLENTGDSSEITLDASTADEGVTFVGMYDGTRTRSWEGDSTKTVGYEFGLDGEFENETESGRVDGKVEVKGSLLFSLESKLEYYISLDRQFVKFEVTAGATLGVEVAGELNINALKLGNFRFSPVAGVIMGFEPRLKLGFSGKLSFSVKVSFTLGFQLEHRKGGHFSVDNLCSAPKTETALEFEGEIFFGVDMHPTVSIISDSVAKFELTGLVGAVITGELKQTYFEDEEESTETMIHGCERCLEGSISVELKIGVEMSFLKLEDLTFSQEVVAARFKLADFYYSLDHGDLGWGTCPHYKFQIRIQTLNEQVENAAGVPVTLSDGTVLGQTNKNGLLITYLPEGNYTFRADIEGQPVVYTKYINYYGGITMTSNEEYWAYLREMEKLQIQPDSALTTSTIDSGTCGDDVSWTLYGSGFLRLTGSGDMDPYQSSSEAPWSEYRQDIKSVHVSEKVTGVAPYAFSGCANLEKVILDDGVKTLGKDAFYNCKALNQVKLPVDLITDGAFAGCENVYKIQYTYGTTGKMAARGKDTADTNYYNRTLEYQSRSSLTTVVFDENITHIANEAFYQCSKLITVKLPTTLVSIGQSAFGGCSSLGSISLPEGLESLGDSCFSMCSSLMEINLPSTLSQIPQYCFSWCTALTELTVPTTVQTLGKDAFYGCTGLKTVTLPVDMVTDSVFGNTGHVTVIHYTYGKTGVMALRADSSNDENYHTRTLEYYNRQALTTVSFDQGITTVANFSFLDCTVLTGVDLPETLVSIGSTAFSNCTALETIELPRVTSLGAYCFRNCTALTEIQLPSSLTVLPEGCFQNCRAMKVLVLPDVVTSLGENAFYGCTELVDVTLPVDLITENAFGTTGKITRLHYTVGQDGKMAERGSSGSDPNYYARTLEYANRQVLTSVSFDEGVATVANRAFSDCVVLTNVTLPSSIHTVGDYAFYGCKALKTVKLPQGRLNLGSNCFASCMALTTIQLPVGLIKLGSYCFSDCTSLTGINFPATLATVSQGAFQRCTALKELVIPKTVTTLEEDAFYGCTGLTQVTIPVDLPTDSAFTNTGKVETIRYTCGTTGAMAKRAASGTYDNYYARTLEYYNRQALSTVTFDEGITSVANRAFTACEVLTDVTLPQSLQTVGDYAFTGCKALEAVLLPEGLSKLGTGCFSSCSALTGVNFPSTLDTIPEYAFQHCTVLKELVIPKTVTTLEEDAFYGCVGLSKITIPVDLPTDSAFTNPGKVETIHYTPGSTGEMAKRATSGVYANYYGRTLEYCNRGTLTAVIFDEGITTVANRAFSDCVVLTNVTLPSSIHTVGDYAFYGCKTLKTVKLPQGRLYLGSYCFASCTALTTVQLPEGLSGMGTGCFSSCSALTGVNFPSTLDTIPRVAFQSCTALKEVVIPKTVTSLEEDAFYGCTGLTKVTIPVDLATDSAFTNTGKVETIHYTPGSTGEMAKRATSGVSANYYGRTLEYYNRQALSTVTFDEGITSVANRAFTECAVLTDVTLPQSLQTVGDYAFTGCKALEAVLLPEGLSKLGTGCFSSCSALTGVNFPSTLDTIPGYAFQHCSALKELVIPKTVTTLEEDAFYGCVGLSKITIPVDLPTDSAFTNTGKVETIHYTPGSTGEMAKRATSGVSANYYGRTLEYYNRQALSTVTFDEGITSVANRAFTDASALRQVIFYGDCPAIGENAFYGVTAEVFYPQGNGTYLADTMGNFGGTLTWTPKALEQPAEPAPITVSRAVSAPTQEESTPAPAEVAYGTGTVTGGMVQTQITKSNQAYEGTNRTEFTEDKKAVQVSSFTGLMPGEDYVMLAVVSLELEDLLAANNLLFIEQGTAAEDGTLSFRYVQRVPTDSFYVFVCGASDKSLADAQVVLPSMQANGEAQALRPSVTYDGKRLVEEVHYIITEGAVFTDGGTYTATLRGINEYSGLNTFSYTVSAQTNAVIPTLTLKSPTLEFKDMITVNAMFTAENTEDVVEMGMITYSSKVDVWNVETAEHVVPGTTYDVNTGRYIAHSQGIHAKYLGDTVYMAVYAKLTDGSYAYSSKLAPYSPVQYATSQLKNSSDVKLKQLVAAMLNYGAEAQLFFGHNTENLANASLTADQKALPESYRADMVNAVPNASAEKQGIFANNKGFSKRYPAISFEGAFCINYFFKPNYTPVGDITLYYWKEADFAAADVLTAENASGSLKLAPEDSGEYRGDIVGISAKNLSEAVYVAAVYSDGTTTWSSGVLGYSIGAYCSGQSSKGAAVAALAEATAVYGYHAKQYFG